MSRHLSSEQISRWVMGEHGAFEEEHVRDCPECRAEVARLESVLAQFRSSAMVVAQSAPPAVRRCLAMSRDPRCSSLASWDCDRTSMA